MLSTNPLAQSYGIDAVVCRRPVVPACDPVSASSGTNPPSVNNETLLVKAGDILDVGLDWTQWLDGNGGSLLSSTWAAHALSPQAPTLTNITLIDEKKQHALCILDASAAVVGNIFYLENTVVIETDPSGGFTMPNRTLKRVVYVRIVL